MLNSKLSCNLMINPLLVNVLLYICLTAAVTLISRSYVEVSVCVCENSIDSPADAVYQFPPPGSDAGEELVTNAGCALVGQAVVLFAFIYSQLTPVVFIGKSPNLPVPLSQLLLFIYTG